jgi:hypothetical protein
VAGAQKIVVSRASAGDTPIAFVLYGAPDQVSLDQDPRIVPGLRSMFDLALKEMIKSQFEGVDLQIWDDASIMEGSTDSVTARVALTVHLMFKWDVKAVPQEIDGYRVMGEVLPDHTLKLLYHNANKGLLCIPYLATGVSLHDIVKDSLLSETEVITLYEEIARHMLALWTDTYRAVRPNYENHFEGRMRSRTKKAQRLFHSTIVGQRVSFSELLRLPLVVNDVEYPPLGQLCEDAWTMIRENASTFSVTAHRDEHAKNILVNMATAGQVPAWYLVDLPNVQRTADWVWSIAKMRHWWLVYYYLDQAKRTGSSRAKLGQVDVRFEATDERVLIEYDLAAQIPSICRKLDERVERLAEQVGLVLEDQTWRSRYPASLFLVYYGSVAYHERFQHVIPVLLGEAAKAMTSDKSLVE